MSKTPSLEEVKKHFENAKVVRCLSDGIVYDITEQALTNIFINEVGYWIRTGKYYVFLRNANKYAEIIKYKKPKQMKDNCVLRKPSPQEVKEYFKDAVTIESISRYNACTFDFSKSEITKNLYWANEGYHIHYKREGGDSVVTLWKRHYGYAFISSYKTQEPTNQKQMTYTLDQIAKHGKLMQEYAKDRSITLQYRFSNPGWLNCSSEPEFNKNAEYRKKPETLFINELGEEFTRQDGMDNIAVFQYSIENKEICINDIVDTLPAGNKRLTEISKTEQGALQLAINKLNK